MHAAGEFQVKMTPQPAPAGYEGSKLGRFLLDKEFEGDLNAESLGEMISYSSEVSVSSVYVAM